MTATLAFSLIAAGLVLLAGRKDAARDPRLTLLLLVLMAALPALAAFAPKVAVLPTMDAGSSAPRFGVLAFAMLALLGASAASALSVLGAKVPAITGTEARLRLSADPFPGER